MVVGSLRGKYAVSVVTSSSIVQAGDSAVGDCHGDGSHNDGGVGYGDDDDSDDSFEARTMSCISL